MTYKEHILMIVDLFGRLPYGVFVNDDIVSCDPVAYTMDYHPNYLTCQTYLRPMSSMTDKEREEFANYCCIENTPLPTDSAWVELSKIDECINWLNAHMLDYRGLIEKGIVLEAPEDMYKTE